MMPVAGTTELSETVDHKKKYKALKRKLRFLVYEHESFLEELKKSQRKLLKISRDRSFLLDRLIKYEKFDESSSDSDATASSDSEADAPKEASSKKRKLSGSTVTPAPTITQFKQEPPNLLATMGLANPAKPPATPQTPLIVSPKGAGDPPKKRQKVTKKAAKSGASSTGRPTVAQALEQQEQQLRQQQQLQQHLQQQQQQQSLPVSLAETLQPGHMTREELERHLEYKQSTKPQFMSIDKAPNMLPDDIFNDENSNSDSLPTVSSLPKILIKR